MTICNGTVINIPEGSHAVTEGVRPTMLAHDIMQFRKRFLRLVAALTIGAAGLVGAILLSSGDAAIAAGPDQVVVRARGTSGTEAIELHLNGDRVATWTTPTDWTNLSYQVPSSLEIRTAEVHFVNDLGIQRDVLVDYIELGGVRLESESRSTISTGTAVRGEGCAERPSTSQALHCAGYFRYAVPAGTILGRPATSGATVAVRARGTTGSEELHLRINGSAVRSFTASTSWETFTYDSPAGTTISQAEVAFVNDNGARDLWVDYLDVDGVRYESESPTTRVTGAWSRADGCSSNAPSTGELLSCSGWFRYSVGSTGVPSSSGNGLSAAIRADRSGSANLASATASETPSAERVTPTETTTAPVPTTAVPIPSTAAPATTTTAAPAVTTTTAPAPAPQLFSTSNGRYTIAQVIDGTISAGDGSNPNEEAPMGRHDAPLALPQGWNWTQGPTRNSVWGQLGTGGSRFTEWRCAVIPERGHTPPVDFRVNVRNGAYYQFANGNWNKAFDVNLTGGNRGAYLGVAGRENQNPFDSGSHGQIQWRREADGSFSAPWNPQALMMHFWASQRQSPAPGQTAEFLTSEIRLQQPDGRNVDLSQVRVLFQCGIDYYNTTGGQGTRVPGPGIAKYQFASAEWQPGLWVTLPGSAPANSVADFERWLRQNTPPNVTG